MSLSSIQIQSALNTQSTTTQMQISLFIAYNWVQWNRQRGSEEEGNLKCKDLSWSNRSFYTPRKSSPLSSKKCWVWKNNLYHGKEFFRAKQWRLFVLREGHFILMRPEYACAPYTSYQVGLRLKILLRSKCKVSKCKYKYDVKEMAVHSIVLHSIRYCSFLFFSSHCNNASSSCKV